MMRVMRAANALTTAILLVACQPDRGGFGASPPSENPALSSTPTPLETRAAARISIWAPGGLRFEPENLEAPAGATAEIEFANRDSQEHTFVVSELAVALLAGAGQTVRSSVAIDRRNRGRFPFFCSIPGHREAGMEGTIEVR